MSYRKVGGLHFLRMWRFGASFYIARRYSTAGELRAMWAREFRSLMSAS